MLEGMDFFSFHGCFKEEQIIGSRFIVDLSVETDTQKAEASDHLRDTLDYVKLYQCVKKEMEQKSYLLEHVCCRMINAIKRDFPGVEAIEIRLAKLNPPVGGKMQQVSYNSAWHK